MKTLKELLIQHAETLTTRMTSATNELDALEYSKEFRKTLNLLQESRQADHKAFEEFFKTLNVAFSEVDKASEGHASKKPEGLSFPGTFDTAAILRKLKLETESVRPADVRLHRDRDRASFEDLLRDLSKKEGENDGHKSP